MQSFDTSLQALKALSSALYISSTPYLVAFMAIRVHNKVGLNLNLFAHPDFEATNRITPDEYHRCYHLLQVFQADHLKSPALEKVWDKQIQYADVLEWSADQWSYVCQKGETTTLKDVPTIWISFNILDIGQTSQPLIREVKASDAINCFKSEFSFFARIPLTIFPVDMSIVTGSWASAAKKAQKKESPHPTVTVSLPPRQLPPSRLVPSSAAPSLSFSSPGGSIPSAHGSEAGTHEAGSAISTQSISVESIARTVTGELALLRGIAAVSSWFFLSDVVVRALVPLLGIRTSS